MYHLNTFKAKNNTGFSLFAKKNKNKKVVFDFILVKKQNKNFYQIGKNIFINDNKIISL